MVGSAPKPPLVIGRGETVAHVGETGEGKTTVPRSE
jgi:ABC-type glutathione transport system ATPase component